MHSGRQTSLNKRKIKTERFVNDVTSVNKIMVIRYEFVNKHRDSCTTVHLSVNTKIEAMVELFTTLLIPSCLVQVVPKELGGCYLLSLSGFSCLHM